MTVSKPRPVYRLMLEIDGHVVGASLIELDMYQPPVDHWVKVQFPPLEGNQSLNVQVELRRIV